jgi:HTH-type transcriptional regulator, competence development regulator
MKETFGEYIHKLRIENNLTLTKLAAALDIDQSTLSKIENKKRNVTEEIIPKLADIFDLDVIQLEKEFLSEKIAELIYLKEDIDDLLNLAKEKVNYFKLKKSSQGLLKFN